MDQILVQLHKTGAKGNSLGMTLPKKLSKKYHFGPSTLFSLKVDDQTGDIILAPIDTSSRKSVSADNSSLGSHQQIQAQ